MSNVSHIREFASISFAESLPPVSIVLISEYSVVVAKKESANDSNQKKREETEMKRATLIESRSQSMHGSWTSFAVCEQGTFNDEPSLTGTFSTFDALTWGGVLIAELGTTKSSSIEKIGVPSSSPTTVIAFSACPSLSTTTAVICISGRARAIEMRAANPICIYCYRFNY